MGERAKGYEESRWRRAPKSTICRHHWDSGLFLQDGRSFMEHVNLRHEWNPSDMRDKRVRIIIRGHKGRIKKAFDRNADDLDTTRQSRECAVV